MGFSEILVVLLGVAIMVLLFGMGVFVVLWNTKKQQAAIGITRQRQEEMLSMAQQSLDIHRENRDLLREIRDLLREGQNASGAGA